MLKRQTMLAHRSLAHDSLVARTGETNDTHECTTHTKHHTIFTYDTYIRIHTNIPKLYLHIPSSPLSIFHQNRHPGCACAACEARGAELSRSVQGTRLCILRQQGLYTPYTHFHPPTFSTSISTSTFTCTSTPTCPSASITMLSSLPLFPPSYIQKSISPALKIYSHARTDPPSLSRNFRNW